MQKITPFLWFDKQAEEAMNFYAEVFDGGKVVSIKRYPEGPLEALMKGMEGRVLTGAFELEGQRFMALDGGPYFKFNPTVSFFVSRTTASAVDGLFNKLAEGGSVLMPLQEYPFSKRYAWVQDKYEVSWQIMLNENPAPITPSFMFVGPHHGQAEEAINFYTSIFKNSSVDLLARYEQGEPGEVGKIKYASFKLEGQQFSAMESNFDHKFAPNGAISMYVECETQEEVDYYWQRLSQGGDEQAQQCGWLQDKYGFSWQIIPTALPRLLNDPDKEKSNRVMQAMLKMKKIDIKALEQAADNN